MNAPSSSVQSPRDAAARSSCAVLYNPDGFRADREQVKGRHSAGAGFLKGLVDHSNFEAFHCVTSSSAHHQDFIDLMGQLDPQGRPIKLVHPLDHKRLAEPGCLFLPGPSFDDFVWRRRSGLERMFSLCGVTHTVASDGVVKALGAYLTSPTQPWDALVCTSTSVRQAVEQAIEGYCTFLEKRGGRLHSPVQLPIIPLGVDAARYHRDAETAQLRADLRQRLNIAEDDVAVLFFGRLSFHAKAHPTPMFQALELAQQQLAGTRLHFIMAGQFPNQPIEMAFRDGARQFCPSVSTHFIDGADPEQSFASWFASDIFFSLSDNIQESFGLTPIEAMAAGLPCVVSDWNGYKDTIIDGKTGFRAPTLAAAGSSGVDLADHYATGQLNYDYFIGAAAQAVAVDVGACVQALVDLAGNPDLRSKMGQAGIERAKSVYDWNPVVGQYQALWDDLKTMREGAEPGLGLRAHGQETIHPLYPDPFEMFKNHPTGVLRGDMKVRLKGTDPSGILRQVCESKLSSFALAQLVPEEQIRNLLSAIGPSGCAVQDLIDQCAPDVHKRVWRTLVFLKKYNIVDVE